MHLCIKKPVEKAGYVLMTYITHVPLEKMAATLADGNFKCIFLNENDRIPKFVPRSSIDNTPALVQVMA